MRGFMADDFDPYRKWLGIVPKDQPPNHYRLLGIELFESDPDVIEGAADQLGLAPVTIRPWNDEIMEIRKFIVKGT